MKWHIFFLKAIISSECEQWWNLSRSAQRGPTTWVATFLPDYWDRFYCGNWKDDGDMWRTHMRKAKTHEKMMGGTCGPVSGANKHCESGAQRGLDLESSWTPTSGVLLLHFAALTRRIWTSRGNGFNDRSASVFQHCVGGWSNGAG